MDDEVEKFEITDFDLQNEFSMGQRRKNLTKEQQIYGMWADNSDGEEVEDIAKLPFSKGKVLQKGLNFVAGGIQQAGKEKEKKLDENDAAYDDNDEQYHPKPIFSSHQVDSSDEEDNLPLDFGSRKKTMGFTNLNERNDARELAGFRNHRGVAHFREGGIGDWEKHTTGIGSKLMKMMGYEEGKGLGKNLQGISTPVEAQKRKGKGAIGFYGNERSERSLKDYPTQDSDEEEKTKFEEQLQQWKKTGIKKKIKYTYKTAEEVIQEGKSRKIKPKEDSAITKTKVIDMTGPEMRVLSSYHAIGGQKKF